RRRGAEPRAGAGGAPDDHGDDHAPRRPERARGRLQDADGRDAADARGALRRGLDRGPARTAERSGGGVAPSPEGVSRPPARDARGARPGERRVQAQGLEGRRGACPGGGAERRRRGACRGAPARRRVRGQARPLRRRRQGVRGRRRREGRRGRAGGGPAPRGVLLGRLLAAPPAWAATPLALVPPPPELAALIPFAETPLDKPPVGVRELPLPEGPTDLPPFPPATIVAPWSS